VNRGGRGRIDESTKLSDPVWVYIQKKKLKNVRSVDQHLVEMCSFSFACHFYIHGKRDPGQLLEIFEEFDIIYIFLWDYI
jgi:hypothetical protein